MQSVAELSKTQVNKAGKVLRSWQQGDEVPDDRLLAALQVLRFHRRAHRSALERAVSELRSALADAGCDAEVSSRLKRERTIIDKLRRQPTMQLAGMRDLAGCRATVSTNAELRQVAERVIEDHPVARVADYVAEPRSSGYRGVHVIVTHEGRPVEVQLRTEVMHQWAITVERLGFATGYDLKSGEGPAELLDRLRDAALTAAAEEDAGKSGHALEILDSVRVDLESRFRQECR